METVMDNRIQKSKFEWIDFNSSSEYFFCATERQPGNDWEWHFSMIVSII